MNKKILMSVAAAATIATTFTGCGSDDNASTSTISGNAVKASLNGARVTLGNATPVSTDANGAFTLSVPSTESETVISITGGTYNLGGERNNSMTLKATKAQIQDNVPASVMTTLVQEFDGNITKAANILGINYVEGASLNTISPTSFENAAVQIEFTYAKMANSSQQASFFNALEANATTINTGSALRSLLTAGASAIAGVTDANFTKSLEYAEQGYFGAAIDISNGADQALVNPNDDKYKTSNVINLEANSTTGNRYSVNEGNSTMSIGYANGAIDASNNMDNNNTEVQFALKDYNATLSTANGNTSLFLKLIGLDAANAKNQYMMGLTGLDINNTSDMITFNSNASMALATIANSNTSYAISVDSNASVLNASDMFLGTDGNFTTINVSVFKNYMDSLYANSSSSTNGNFTNGMTSGNFSLQVYVNVADQNVTYNNRLTSINSDNMTQTSDEDGSKVFNGLYGYKVIDSNLSY